MSDHGKMHQKRWRISRLKTSGSKRKYVIDGDYADTRHSKRNRQLDGVSMREGMGRSARFYNGKINYGLMRRFLRGQVGRDWVQVEKEISKRIPRDLPEYQECVRWFVADRVAHTEQGLWDRRSQRFLYLDRAQKYSYVRSVFKEFYVDPVTNRLVEVRLGKRQERT